jgi:RNA polymerase sigma factor (sigma-70 family)
MTAAEKVAVEKDVDLIALNDAMKDLTKIDPLKAEIVELRFFGGLTVDETAEVLKLSPRTVDRDWKMAKAWLFKELRKRAENA